MENICHNVIMLFYSLCMSPNDRQEAGKTQGGIELYLDAIRAAKKASEVVTIAPGLVEEKISLLRSLVGYVMSDCFDQANALSEAARMEGVAMAVLPPENELQGAAAIPVLIRIDAIINNALLALQKHGIAAPDSVTIALANIKTQARLALVGERERRRGSMAQFGDPQVFLNRVMKEWSAGKSGESE